MEKKKAPVFRTWKPAAFSILAVVLALFVLADQLFEWHLLPSVTRCPDANDLDSLDVSLRLDILTKQISDNKKLGETVHLSIEKLQNANTELRTAEEEGDLSTEGMKRMLEESRGVISRVLEDDKAHIHPESLIQAIASRTAAWASKHSPPSSCPPCTSCPKEKEEPGQQHNCAASGFLDCGCKAAVSGTRKFPGGQNEEKPLCLDGASPGAWVNFSHWEPHNCRLIDYSTENLRECLAGRWIHFFGDSLSRLMANDFSRKLGMQRRNWENDKNRSQLMDTRADEVKKGRRRRRALLQWRGPEEAVKRGSSRRRKSCNGSVHSMGGPVEAGPRGQSLELRKQRRKLLVTRDEWPRVTYLFRGKFAHQRHPADNTSEEHDLNNKFLDGLAAPGSSQPDYLVLGIGAHEVIGWNARPPPDMSIEVFKSDVEELLVRLKKTINRSKTKLVWWKGHFIWPGKVLQRNYFKVWYFHERFQAYAFKRFQEEGYTVADFYQTTETRPELIYRPDGVHYGGEALDVHTRILSNIMCNGEMVEYGKLIKEG